MKDYVFLLFSIGVLYYFCWFHTSWRRESVLIEVNKKLAKILGFIGNGRKISIVSIILGLYAHMSIILYVILFVYAAVSKTSIDLGSINKIGIVLAFLLGAVGEEIETFIKIKRAETVKQKIEFFLVAIILLVGLFVVTCILAIDVLQFNFYKNGL